MSTTNSTTTTTNPSQSALSLRPKVGVGVFILRPSASASASTSTGSPSSPYEFILGRRLGSHGANTWALPGGHLEHGESFETCAAREVLEETGLAVTNARFLTATNDVMSEEGRHYVTVFVVCEVDDEGRGGGKDVEPKVMEPEKCAGWEWFGWEELVRWVERGDGNGGKGELFLPLVNLVRQRPGVVPLLF